MTSAKHAGLRKFSPPSEAWRTTRWERGAFDSAVRPFAAAVEGRMALPDHVILVTLAGGARRVDVRTDCGHRFSGRDRAGAVSFLPAGCGRDVLLRDVRTRWASLTLAPELFADERSLAPFTNVDEPLLAALAAELARAQGLDGTIDALVLEAAALLAARRIEARLAPRPPSAAPRLSPWRVRRVTEYVEANLDRPLRIADVAALVGLSAAHFHRAFRAATGQTPLAFITERRVDAAAELLRREGVSVTDAALRVGFGSTSHFARTFRRVRGEPPSALRRNATGGSRR